MQRGRLAGRARFIHVAEWPSAEEQSAPVSRGAFVPQQTGYQTFVTERRPQEAATVSGTETSAARAVSSAAFAARSRRARLSSTAITIT